MARYTVLKQIDIDEINRYYSLSIVNFEPMVGGAGNSSYILTTQKGKLIATIFDDKSFAYVSRVEKLLRYLAANDFQTTRIVAPAIYSAPVMLLSDKPLLVKEFISGEVHTTLDKSMLVQVGVAVAELHQISAPDFLPRAHPYGVQEFPSVFEKGIDPEYEELLAERYKYLNQRIPINMPTSLIHGDLFYDNILFKGEKLAALIDFEEACHYYRVFDIGMGIVGMCTEMGVITLDNAQEFVRGYQQVQILEDDEKNNLQLFVEYAAIATSYWRFRKYNIRQPIPDKAGVHMQMVEIANAARSIPKEEFLTALF